MSKMIYCVNQLDTAAKFIFKNNKILVETRGLKNWLDVREMILGHMQEQLNMKNNWSATGGWILVFTDHGKDTIECEIFVDTNVSGECNLSGEISC